MEEFLSWLGWAAAALLLVGVVVAGWEHLVREAQACDRDRNREAFISQQPQAARHAAVPVDVPVDVRLDTQAAALYAASAEAESPAPALAPISTEASAESERAARVSVMTRVLALTNEPGLRQPERNQWMDTTPRIIGLNEPPSRKAPEQGDTAAGQSRSRASSQGR